MKKNAARLIAAGPVEHSAQVTAAQLIVRAPAEQDVQVSVVRLIAAVLAEQTVPVDVPTPARQPVALLVQAIALYNAQEIAR